MSPVGSAQWPPPVEDEGLELPLTKDDEELSPLLLWEPSLGFDVDVVCLLSAAPSFESVLLANVLPLYLALIK